VWPEIQGRSTVAIYLRGWWDERTEESIENDDDMWLQLFDAIHPGHIVFWDYPYGYEINYRDSKICGPSELGSCDLLFCRGGFDYYSEFINQRPSARKIYYGAGRRWKPTDTSTNYDVILCDSAKQAAELRNMYPSSEVSVWAKPAAECVTPVQCDKKYDICYIANWQQRSIKGIDWVYDSCPRDLRILHLGRGEPLRKLANVEQLCSARKDIHKHISKCITGVAPYWSGVDSAPRSICEMRACGLPVVCADTVAADMLGVKYATPKSFWRKVRDIIVEKGVM